MRTLVIFLGLLFSATSAHAKSPEFWKGLHYVNDCRIITDWEGKTLKRFPGRLCLFLDDGRFVSATPRELSLYDWKQKKLWSISGHFHHQLNLSVDRKTILTLSSFFEKRGEDVVRYDRLLRVALDGTILNERSSESLFADPKFIASGIRIQPVPFNWELDRAKDANFELGHFNSIYEVPGQTLPKPLRLFEKGQVVVNSIDAGIFILSSDLKTVVFFTTLKNSPSQRVHDVQVLADGTFLYFNNRNADPTRLYSSVDIYDPRKMKRVFTYTPQPEEFFYSLAAGGVQLLEGNALLFSDLSKGVFIIDKDSRKLIKAIPQLSFGQPYPEGPVLPVMAQQIKAFSLHAFLEHWR